jgi:hypothetical protein
VRLIAGWKAFKADMENFQYVEVIPAAVATPEAGLPSVFIRVEGSIALVDNLPAFGEILTDYIARMKVITEKDKKTDQDYADLEQAVRNMKRAEEELDAAENSALGQTESIDSMRKTVAMYRAMARDNRLLIDKLVKAEKESRKAEIIVNARKAIEEHIQKMNVRIGGNWMPAASAAPFAEAVKGLKTLDSMREKVGTALRDMMFEASLMADRIESNRKSLTGEAHDWMFLFPDFPAVCQKPVEDFAAMLSMRITNHKAAEDKRLEAEREKIRAEERAKAEAEAQAKAKAEKSALDAEEMKKRAEFEHLQREEAKAFQRQAAEQAQGRAAMAEAEQLIASAKSATATPPIEQSAETAESENLLKLGQIGERLGFSVTAELIASLGILPKAQDRSAKLYSQADFIRVCDALIARVTAARNAQYQPQ